MKTGLTISTVGHLAILVWAVVTFVTKPFDSAPAESLPIDIISTDQFSKLTAGQRDAKQTDTPKPMVEKIGDPNKVEPTKAKINEKKEVVATTEATPPPPPPEEKKIEKKEKKPTEAKVDPIAEALKKDEAKKPEEKKAEVKPPPAPPKKPIPIPPKFDPMKIAALLNKQEPQRAAVTGSTLNSVPSLGVSSGQSATLSQNELDAFRARLAQLWNPPAAANPQDLVVVIRVQLKRDGTLLAPPVVLTSGSTPGFVAARDSAVRALFRGQPYNMLRQETYDSWNDIEIKFDPREMFGG